MKQVEEFKEKKQMRNSEAAGRNNKRQSSLVFIFYGTYSEDVLHRLKYLFKP